MSLSFHRHDVQNCKVDHDFQSLVQPMRSLFRRQRANQMSVFRKLSKENRPVPSLEIIGLEAGRHGRSHQGKSAAGDQTGPLPDAPRNQHLGVHASLQVIANYERINLPIWMKLDHLHGITKIEVKDFVAGQPVKQ